MLLGHTRQVRLDSGCYASASIVGGRRYGGWHGAS